MPGSVAHSAPAQGRAWLGHGDAETCRAPASAGSAFAPACMPDKRSAMHACPTRDGIAASPHVQPLQRLELAVHGCHLVHFVKAPQLALRLLDEVLRRVQQVFGQLF